MHQPFFDSSDRPQQLLALAISRVSLVASICETARVRFDIVIFDGVDEMDALGPLEVLRSAATMGADIDAWLVTRDRQVLVEGAHRLRFEPDDVFRPGRADVVIVTGGGWVANARNGTRAEVASGHLLTLLGEAQAATPVMAGVCTGTMLLAHAGVVGERRATTHHSALPDLADLGATVVQDRVVDDGSLVTSGGVTSGIDLALWLVEREFSREVADNVAQRMEYPRWRPATD